MTSTVKRVLLGLLIFFIGFIGFGSIAFYPYYKVYLSDNKNQTENIYLDESLVDNTKYDQLYSQFLFLKEENENLSKENKKLKLELEKKKSVNLIADFTVPEPSKKSYLYKYELLADRLARDLDIRNYLRSQIIYDDYNPVTKEQNYCETSKAAKAILDRTAQKGAVVYALIEYDPNGYFIVLGNQIIGNPAMMTEAVIHEITHCYCTVNNLSQGGDEHSDYYTIWYKKIKDYVYFNLKELL